MRATVTFEDGKIVCVQKAKKEGQKSTKVCLYQKWQLFNVNLFIITPHSPYFLLLTVYYLLSAVCERDERGWRDDLHNDHWWEELIVKVLLKFEMIVIVWLLIFSAP